MTYQEAEQMVREWKKTRRVVRIWALFTGVVFPVVLLLVQHWLGW